MYKKLSPFLLMILMGCNEDNYSIIDDKQGEQQIPIVPLPPIVKEDFITNIISPPEVIEDEVSYPPTITGITEHPNESYQTVISSYSKYPVNNQLAITQGKLNHTDNEKITSLEFIPGNGLNLVPLERTTGQWSLQTTTDTANQYISHGRNIIASFNADPFNTYNGWAVGITKIDGETYTGATLTENSKYIEGAVVVMDDGTIDIWDSSEMPIFTLNWYLDGTFIGEVARVHYFDNENKVNKGYSHKSEINGIEIYPGDNFRGCVILDEKSIGYIINPNVNGITVFEDNKRNKIAQFAPFSGVVEDILMNGCHYIPSGQFLVKSLQELELNIGQDVSVKFETNDERWKNVRHALGAGFGEGLLVDNGIINDGQSELNLSSATAIGVKKDGSIVTLVVDKPVGSPQAGVTNKKLAQLMVGYGAIKAIRLDGGGSSTIAMRLPQERQLRLLNNPSDGSERKVATKWGLELVNSNINYPDKIVVYPKEITILKNAIYDSFSSFGYDSSYNPINGLAEYGTNTDKIGMIKPHLGTFKAGSYSSEGYVVARYRDNLVGVSKVKIVDSISSISLNEKNISLNPGDEYSISVTAYTEDGNNIYTNPNQFLYVVENQSAGTVDPQTGIFTANNVFGETTDVYVIYGDTKDKIVINVGTPPVVIEDFEDGIGDYIASGARIKESTLKLSDEKSISGIFSAKLEWKADPSAPGTFGAYMVDPNKRKSIIKIPKYLGVYVYIPDELSGKNWWMRGQLRDSDGKAIALNYNNSDDLLPSPGWHFVQAEVPKGYKAPLYFDMPFRFLVLSTPERIDSEVYLDNFMAIYSDETDLEGPEVNVYPENGSFIESNKLDILLQAFDKTGVDVNSLSVKLDGLDISSYIHHDDKNLFSIRLNDVKDGWHKLEYRVSDIISNISSGESLFKIDTGLGSINIEHNNVSEYNPGGEYIIPITYSGHDNFGFFNLSINYDSTKFKLEVLNGDLEPNNIITDIGLWSGTFEKVGSKTPNIAYIKVSVNEYIKNSDLSIVINGNIDGNRFYFPVIRKPISSKYKLANQWIRKNIEGRMFIIDSDSKPADNVNVEVLQYDFNNDVLLSSEFVGRTNEYGILDYNLSSICEESHEWCSDIILFRAYDSHGGSLITSLYNLDDNLDDNPSFVQIQPGKDNTEINITWYTSLQNNISKVEYGIGGITNESYGNSEIIPFFYGKEPGLVRVHHVKLNNLILGKKYFYRVSCKDNIMSNLFSFNTVDEKLGFNIYLYGDTQTSANGNAFDGAPLISEIWKKMQGLAPRTGNDIIMHVGDFTEDLSDYNLVKQFFEALDGLDGLSTLPFVVAQGNHEVYNDGSYKFASMFNYPSNINIKYPYNKAIYSFDWLNSHISVITTEVFEPELWESISLWLEEDMMKTDKKWKILMLHRPIYEANRNSGNGLVKKYLENVIDKLDLDLVISGHDHIYARSFPVKYGKISGSGTTYIVAGSASAKFYDSYDGGISPLSEVLYDENIHVYSVLSVNKNDIQIETRNIKGYLIDSKTIRK
ncbi:metallophosphoesterase [Vibrio cholerae]|nr:metallophosphoesterase [Vibrio cholerae]